MKKHLLTFFSLAFATAAWAAPTGDIYSIDGLSAPLDPVAGYQAGETVQFRVRLMARDWSDPQPKAWTMKYIGLGSEAYDAAMNPLKIGIVISGKLRGATVMSVTPGTSASDPAAHPATDLICEYVVQPGDLADPVQLALTGSTTDKPVVPTSGSVYDLSYCLLNGSLWQIENTAGVAANFLYASNTDATTAKTDWQTDYDFGTRVQDLDLSVANFKVRSVEFDKTWAANATVHEGPAESIAAAVKTIGTPTEATTFYVWSDDETVVKMAGAAVTTAITLSDGTIANRDILTITTEPGTKEYALTIQGLLQGATTKLILSPTKGYVFDKAGHAIKNYLEVPITCIEPPAPYLTMGWGLSLEGTKELTADADYKTVKAELIARISEAFATDVTVDLTAKYAEDDAAIDLATEANLVLSASNKGAGWSTRTTQVKIPAGSTEAKFYLYVRGATAKTANGIIIKAEVNGDGDKYDDASVTAELLINQTNPKIAVPVDGQVYEGARTGEEFALEDFKISDTYANLQNGATAGYTIYYKRTYEKGGDTKWQKLATPFKTGLNGMAATEDDALKIKLTRAGTATVQFYVKAPDGSESDKAAPRTITVKVTQAPQVSAYLSSGLNEDETVNEGTELQVKFTLSEENSTGDTLYAYLVPADDETRANVDTAKSTAIAGAGAKGVAIADGATSSILYAKVNFKDGTPDNNLMTFTVFVSPEKVLVGAPDEATYPDTGYAYDDSFAFGTLQMFVVNVEPTAKYVQMNGAEQVTTSGGQFVAATAQGIACTFATFVNEPSSIDLEAADPNQFYTRYTFYDGTAAPQVKIVPGNPNTMTAGVLDNTVEFTFQSAGLNKVVVAMKDKDMDDYTDEAHSFVCFVQVNATPGVMVKSGRNDGLNSYPESDVGPTDGAVSVTLTAACDKDLEAGLLVEHAKATDTFALPTLNLPTRTIADGELAGKTVYVVTFKAGYTKPTQEAYFTFIDGLTAAAQNGVKITPVILSDEMTSYGKTQQQLYTFLTPWMMFAENVAPTIVEPADISMTTNKASIGVAYTRSWSVRDIEGDFKSAKAKVEATVEGTTMLIAQGSDTDESAITNGGEYTFEFTSSGAKTVVFTVTDKDGGQTTRELFFMIDPSKNVYVYPHGPNQTVISTLSSKYLGATGLGTGKVWKEGDALNKYAARHIYAFPQSANTGIFNGMGDLNDDGYDSFLYTWIVSTAESGHFTGSVDGYSAVLAPRDAATIEASAETYERSIQLAGADEYDEAANAYADRYLEAIFSKEYRKSDNMGDINQDGVPDYFAVKRFYSLSLLLEAAGYTTENAGDLNSLAGYNGDEDFLPGQLSQGAGLNAPGAMSGWSNVGGAFNARTELRGAGEGLNYVHSINGVRTLISDVDFTLAEQYAWLEHHGVIARYDGTMMMATDETLLVADAAEDEREEVNKDNIGARFNLYLDAVKEDLVKGNDDGGWSPERPTDPTLKDTDSDGMDDGAEYYFWYKAKVGTVDGDGNWNGRLTGRKFNEDDIEKYDEITSDDILATYDPLKNTFNFGARDTDNDGLSDLEELLIGSNPINCDTDGDGLIDGWEILRGLSPIDASGDNGASGNPDGDAMARVDLPSCAILTVTQTAGTAETVTKYLIPMDNEKPMDNALNYHGIEYYRPQALQNRYNAITEENPEVDVPVNDPTTGKPWILSAIKIGDGESFTIAGQNCPTANDTANLAFCREQVLIPEDTGAWTYTAKLSKGGNWVLLHHQVYVAMGFDPRTGWNGGNQDSARYENRDEYLLYKWRKGVGIGIAGDTVMDRLKNGTTNPNTAFDAKSWGDSTTQYASAQHGADTDGDGIPDGWELYVGTDPSNAVVAENRDNDNDGLDLQAEFAGTSSCGAYGACASITNPRPAWKNKTMPTDPNNRDTDGDGLSDGAEGAGVMTYCVYGRRGQDGRTSKLVATSFLYDQWNEDGRGGITEGGCVRGGGCDPNSIDTDGDGLPDPWEVAFAGVLFTPAGQPVEPTTSGGFEAIDLPDEVLREVHISDSIPDNREIHADRYYISMGMDPTNPNDAGLPVVDSYMFYPETIAALDDSTAKVYPRDYDWDHDGLLNWQEYYVQALRHLRYDDAITPLMGHDMTQIGTGVKGAFGGFLKTNPFDLGETYATVTNMADTTTFANWRAFVDEDSKIIEADPIFAAVVSDATDLNGFAEYFHSIEDLQRLLGYFARTRKVWDPNYAAGRMYMLPPTVIMDKEYDLIGYMTTYQTANGYLSTDPRYWDTDEDGMDDYYELFHGLNPILGSSAQGEKDMIAEAYLVGVSAWQNAWTGWDNEVQPTYDAVLYPWMIGTPECDADGDGLRNENEALKPDLTNPQPTHTDPTPLWMTDNSGITNEDGTLANASFVEQYYQIPVTSRIWDGLGIPSDTTLEQTLNEGKSLKYAYAFEVNEGFDTDNDWKGDTTELESRVEGASDPLDAADPVRRQGVYLGGEGALVTRQATTRPMSDNYDFFRQFTVEAWVRPETPAAGHDQFIVARACNYGPATLVKDQGGIRANFALYLTDQGVPVAMFQNNDVSADPTITTTSAEHTQRTLGLKPLTAATWTHLAATYDGAMLRLYVNGQEANASASRLEPANGVTAILQDPLSGVDSITNTLAQQFYYPAMSYKKVPSVLMVGAYPKAQAFDISEGGLWDETAENSYVGWIDEVRTWDGARTAEEIAESYKTSFTTAEIVANRKAVFEAYCEGGRRSKSLSKVDFPAELVQNYNFSTLPSAVEPDGVMVEPAGFRAGVLDNVSAVAEDSFSDIGWWTVLKGTEIGSSVYASTKVVPWAENLVGRLPLISGDVMDSCFWGESFAGYTPAYAQDLGKYSFPNSANPYSQVSYDYQNYAKYAKYRLLVNANAAENTDYLLKMFWDLRSSFVSTTDLVPLGDAFAKRCTDSWDAYGPEDFWTETVSDSDGFGLPDWWVELARGNYCQGLDPSVQLTPETLVSYTLNGKVLTITAKQAYILDLNRGMQPDGTYADAYSTFKVDRDQNTIPDWWEELYGITGTKATDDTDGDGLSNFQEYLISEVLHYADLDPKNARSNGQTLDYLRKVGELYLGEIFTDHDGMDNQWEATQDPAKVNPYLYDSHIDAMGNGWSNYAQFRAKDDASTWVQVGSRTNLTTVVFDAGTQELTLFAATNTAEILLYEYRQLYDGYYWAGTGDGSYIVSYKAGDWVSTADDAKASASYSWSQVRYTFQTTEPIMAYKNLPRPNITAKVTYNGLQNVSNLTVMAWKDATMKTLPDATWIVTNVVETAGNTRTFIFQVPNTGAVKEGLNTFACYASEDGTFTPGQPYGYVADVDVGWNAASFEIELTDMSPVFARFNVTDGSSDRVTIYGTDSGDGDASSFVINTGKTNKTSVVSSSDAETETETSDLSGGAINHIRVVPYLVWGTLQDRSSTEKGRAWTECVACVTNRVVAEFDVDTRMRPYISEADFLQDGAYDIDWAFFQTEMLNKALIKEAVGDVTAVKYRLVVGTDGPIGPTSTADTSTVVRAYSTLIERRFEPANARTLPTELKLKGGQIVYGGHPTFTWRLDESTDTTGNARSAALFGCSYTAFQIQVADANNTIVYDSGLQRTPVKDADGRFVWTAPLSAGTQTDLGKLFAKVGNWKWRVAMYNAKFKPTTRESSNGWSSLWTANTCATFSTAVGQQQTVDDHGYGSVLASVKYAGPSAVLAGGVVRVQAFATPDCAGLAAGETVITDKATVSDTTSRDTNAEVVGLKPGSYWVRAFVDTNGNGTREIWESSGQTIAPVTVAKTGDVPEIEVVIDDADTDGDWLPDAWEMTKYGTLDHANATVEANGNVILGNESYDAIMSDTTLFPVRFTDTSFLLFRNLDAASLLLGLDATTGTQTTIDAIREALKPRVAGQTVRISSLSVNAPAQTVSLTVEGEVEETEGMSRLSSVYAFTPMSTDVEIVVYRKNSLVEKDWTETGSYTATVTTGLDTTVEVPVADDLTSGFYKIEVRQ